MYKINVKTLSLSDYDGLKQYESQYMQSLSKNNRSFREQHKHRNWEYMGAVEYLNSIVLSPKNILDVGGCGSPFPYYIKDMTGANVTVIDPDTNSFNDFGIKYIQKLPSGKDFAGYDFISCISVLEHIPDDKAFIKDLVTNMDTNAVVYITCDWFKTGARLVNEHLRTYNIDNVYNLFDAVADDCETEIEIDFDINEENNVNGYNFARITIERIY